MLHCMHITKWKYCIGHTPCKQVKEGQRLISLCIWKIRGGLWLGFKRRDGSEWEGDDDDPLSSCGWA